LDAARFYLPSPLLGFMDMVDNRSLVFLSSWVSWDFFCLFGFSCLLSLGFSSLSFHSHSQVSILPTHLSLPASWPLLLSLLLQLRYPRTTCIYWTLSFLEDMGCFTSFASALSSILPASGGPLLPHSSLFCCVTRNTWDLSSRVLPAHFRAASCLTLLVSSLSLPGRKCEGGHGPREEEVFFFSLLPAISLVPTIC